MKEKRDDKRTEKTGRDKAAQDEPIRRHSVWSAAFHRDGDNHYTNDGYVKKDEPTSAGEEATIDKQTPFMIDDIDGSAAQLL